MFATHRLLMLLYLALPLKIAEILALQGEMSTEPRLKQENLSGIVVRFWLRSVGMYVPPDAQTLMSDFENELFFSVASLWQIVIKCGFGREDFKVDLRKIRRGLLDNGYSKLPSQ